MQKCVFVLNINNYLPDLMTLTLPTIKSYAYKIGAEFCIINKRKFEDFPPTYEKLQIFELGKNYDWNILIDADMLIHPDMYDITHHINTISTWHTYPLNMLFESNEYFKKDGRNMGLVTNFMAVPKQYHNIWKPLEIPFQEAKNYTKREFILDEYCVSLNMAKYNFKYQSILRYSNDEKYFYHLNVNTDNIQNYVKLAESKLKEWKND